MDPPCQPHRLHDRLLHRLCVCPVPAPGRDASGKDAKPPRRRCLKLQPRHDLPRAQVLHFHLLGHRISRTLLDVFIPETKGKTLKEIEADFVGNSSTAPVESLGQV